MKSLPLLPLVFANHPSRSATGIGVYGLNEPRELRANNDLAPEVYRGMEGAPGPSGRQRWRRTARRSGTRGQPAGFRGGYGNAAHRRSAVSIR